MWDTWSSMWRNDASRGLNRSGAIDSPFRGTSVLERYSPQRRRDPGRQPAVAVAADPPREARNGVVAILCRVSS